MTDKKEMDQWARNAIEILGKQGYLEEEENNLGNILVISAIIGVLIFLAFFGWQMYNEKFKSENFFNSTTICESVTIPECPPAPSCPACNSACNPNYNITFNPTIQCGSTT